MMLDSFDALDARHCDADLQSSKINRDISYLEMDLLGTCLLRKEQDLFDSLLSLVSDNTALLCHKPRLTFLKTSCCGCDMCTKADSRFLILKRSKSRSRCSRFEILCHLSNVSKICRLRSRHDRILQLQLSAAFRKQTGEKNTHRTTQHAPQFSRNKSTLFLPRHEAIFPGAARFSLPPRDCCPVSRLPAV